MPHWDNPLQKSLACLVFGKSEPDLFLIFNAAVERVEFSIPASARPGVWHLVVDTSRESPEDFYSAGSELSLAGQTFFRAGSRSSAILLARA
jgi:glycogen operon protein